MVDTVTAIKPAVIVPAYSRPEALRRLLTSINRAQYPSNDIRLMISLDGGANDAVVACAREFQFESGSVEVVERDARLGLREHILWCGDQTREYGAAIVLEDDLVVDPWFYEYALRALAAHEQQDTIAGIALYAPRYNEFAALAFEPLMNGTSGYRMQVPCSWGQAWTERQWGAFRDWYAQAAEDVVESCAALPKVVKDWPASSWKKYFAAYLAESDRYVVYPYTSYTTNFADAGGAHMSRSTDEHQVALPDPRRDFVTPVFQADAASAAAYDPYMEPQIQIDLEALSLPAGSLCVDLYGAKPLQMARASDYCLTTRPVKAAVANYPLQYRPLPMNVLLTDGKQVDGPIRLCRKDQLYDHEPWLQRLQSTLRLKLYFVSGPTDGTSLLTLGIARLLQHLRDLISP